MTTPVAWTDEWDHMLISELERLGSFDAVAGSLTRAGLTCSGFSARRRHKALRPEQHEARMKARRLEPLTTHQRLEVLRMLRAKISGREINAALGVSRTAIERLRKECGLSRGRRGSNIHPEPVAPPAPLRKRLVVYHDGQRYPISQFYKVPKFDRVAVEMV